MRWLKILTPYFVFKTFALTLMPFVAGWMVGFGGEIVHPLMVITMAILFGIGWGLFVYFIEFAPEIGRGQMWWQGGPNKSGADHE